VDPDDVPTFVIRERLHPQGRPGHISSLNTEEYTQRYIVLELPIRVGTTAQLSATSERCTVRVVPSL